MNLNKNEYLTLNHLSEDKELNKAPAGLTDAQYSVALKSLKAKGMVLAEFEEGGGVVDARIRLSGQAALDDYKDVEDHIIRMLIRREKLTEQQYILLKVARDNGRIVNVFGISGDVYKKQIWAPLYNLGYLIKDQEKNEIVISPIGNRLLGVIDKELAFEITDKNQDANTGSQENDSSHIAENGDFPNKELIEDLKKLFYNDIDAAKDFIIKIASTNKNPEKARIAAEYVNNKKISDLSCKKDLWEILHNHGLYEPSLNNWCKSINQYLKTK